MKWDKETKRFIPESFPGKKVQGDPSNWNFEHGTRTKYLFHKCRCAECKQANAEYKSKHNREYRAAGRDKSLLRQMEESKNLTRLKNGA